MVDERRIGQARSERKSALSYMAMFCHGSAMTARRQPQISAVPRRFGAGPEFLPWTLSTASTLRRKSRR